jgi:asparagine synthase (glutamine-hydrolysing)
LTTLSYVFDELKDCDERSYIDPVKERWSIRSIQILCDDAWPYKDWEKWTPNPNDPAANPYYALHDRVYERARAEGIGVLLTGSFGDHLYTAASGWLADLVFEGRWSDAFRQLNIQIRKRGVSQTLKAVYIREVARRIINKIPGLQNSHSPSVSPEWLTDRARELIPLRNGLIDPVLERYDILLGLLTAYSCSHEYFNLSHPGVEVRSPYRDRRLIEYVITLPAYQLYSGGRHKYILRNAMKDILPESVRNRTLPTSMIPLFVRGLGQEKDSLQLQFLDPDAGWRKYIKADWLMNHWNTDLEPDRDGPAVMMFWMCSSFEAWQKSIFSSN